MNLKVNQFCCGCTLQTGVKILSILHMIGAIILLIASALAVGGVSFAYSVLQNVEQESMTDVMTDSSSETQLDLTLSNFEIESVQEPSDSMVVSSVVLIAGLGVTVAQLVFSIFMIVVLGLAIDAAWNNYKPKFLIPWLIVLAIGISGSFIIFIDGISQEKSVGTIISYLFSAALEIYVWIVIYSYYQELIGKEQNSKNNSQWKIIQSSKLDV